MEEKRSYTRDVERIKEKRRHVRVETEKNFPVEVQIMGDTFLDVLYTKDISTRGVGVFVPHEFKGCNIKDDVDLVLTLYNETPFKAKGVIIHKNGGVNDKGFFSVEFTYVSPEGRKLIDGFIQGRLLKK